ncbi:NAD+ kinase [Massilia sp. KIM]|uniref:ATP-NAD kinase family protein n=1 Tax=Massilia sp. KIM TaxID=1955422 RepID=UPI00098EFDB7|nr:ATP-NAD kinase family protein [Massilia sp. KIM]OON64779.1 NAD+ kinase [Massilia sp. KIM]
MQQPGSPPAGHVPTRPRTIGLIVNPIAGMGGRVGLKGTDGDAVLVEARRRGAHPQAAARTLLALRRLAADSAPSSSFTLLTGAGDLGESVAREAGFTPRLIYAAQASTTRPRDTRQAARAMLEAGADLLLFAGGDGTARDVLAAVGDALPVLGIPAGVKMVSAVFGTTPENVGALAARFLAGDPAVRLRDAEVMDVDEDAVRRDHVSARLYGFARSPHLRQLTQNAKAGSLPSGDAALDALAREIAAEMRRDCLYLIGPGTSTRRVMSALGLPSTLLGVDAVLDGRLLGADLDEAALLRLMERHETRIVVGVLGGHGSLFGRGNQQISAEIIRKTGRDNIIAIASLDKLLGLETRCLQVDTGDDETDAMLTGYLPIRTAPDRSIYFQVKS